MQNPKYSWTPAQAGEIYRTVELLAKSFKMSSIDLDKAFSDNPNVTKVADGYIVGDEKAMFHIWDVHSQEDLEGLDHRETFYLPFCTREEILRIRNQKNANDYLLWLRAEAIAENTRAVRVFRKRKKQKKTWSLTRYYRDEYTHDLEYLKLAGKLFQHKVESVPAGMAFVNDVNAMCIKSRFGNVIVVNEALLYFLYYMNVVFFGNELGVKDIDISSALYISLRIMIGNESMDFDLDPRGDLPPHIDHVIRSYTNSQLMFIFGHEYSHHTLNHLNSSKENIKNILTVTPWSENTVKAKVYNYNHRKEYEADLQAIKNVKNNNYIRNLTATSAFFFFIYIDILDHLFRCLGFRNDISTSHPAPLDRLFHLRKKLKAGLGFSKEDLTPFLKYSDRIKREVEENIVRFDHESLEFYGSIYLPSYKGKFLKDRIDF